ncbi:ADP-ribose diphosphatase [Candidatus Enterovibrio altilux]|uniref:ADP-ribose diphosphatase n=1 Tax=Candidatus Enterovibrio altilux TaxID=1927128 RepID=UPI001237B529|nr:ADP-ribose diphosphatase [Candidatus Enterovibrio luxaltus]
MGECILQEIQLNQFGKHDVQIDQSDLVYNGYFKIVKYRFRYRLFAGGWSKTVERELFERGQAAAMLPYDVANDNIILIEQIRIGAMVANVEPWQLEIVAGIIDKDETPDMVAIRESEEEAGLLVKNLIPITSYLSSSGGCSERIHLYLGQVDVSTASGIHGLPKKSEDILVHIVPREMAYQWVLNGKIENAASIIALQWLMLNVESLR